LCFRRGGYLKMGIADSGQLLRRGQLVRRYLILEFLYVARRVCG
jgi:hypothetical protein